MLGGRKLPEVSLGVAIRGVTATHGSECRLAGSLLKKWRVNSIRCVCWKTTKQTKHDYEDLDARLCVFLCAFARLRETSCHSLVTPPGSSMISKVVWISTVGRSVAATLQ